ncbi:MAG: hypothetical protein IM537_01650 [Pseudanabaena sp. M57BS1SP1A06MG]|uniref:hypothetical protein n=1 Tax=Pseudanabaena mucicola TaxID=71190 RepID=UPI002577461F|nr:hypothetical protein [Pseudanabaena mucicola]MCA6572035.1 hypothetical protein [Pseudanabaena sp. M53BS1SP1A06MG]MCA6584173.1 hypothetical protein [Pseudanabaena sp. M34BS1SP1A06MG]MCA6590896.1 hypothetical protein [Pseudanabaena sp. M38BS1SP1A06MG]MCA6598941.1 hypothetical protein [Pseudanabaena sp. M57BS1SP1A06MG]
MVRYTLAQSPEVVLTVAGKDSPKARDKAMAELIELMDSGKLDTDLADGFSPDQFIEVRELSMSEDREDPITQAVQILNNLATLKIKVQELRSDAMQVRSQIDILFSDEIVSEEQINSIKEGFKTLKNFAQLNMKFLDARSQAEKARQVLDEALKSPNSEVKVSEIVVEVPTLIESETNTNESDDAEVTCESVTEVDNAIVEVPVSKSTKKK